MPNHLWDLLFCLLIYFFLCTHSDFFKTPQSIPNFPFYYLLIHSIHQCHLYIQKLVKQMFLFFHYLASIVTLFSPAKLSLDTHPPELLRSVKYLYPQELRVRANNFPLKKKVFCYILSMIFLFVQPSEMTDYILQ